VRSTSFAVVVLAALLSVVTPTLAQVSANVLRRVLEIRVGGPTGFIGTAFTLDVDGREYLVTAKHMVENLKRNDAIEISVRTAQWDRIGVTVYPCDGDADTGRVRPLTQILSRTHGTRKSPVGPLEIFSPFLNSPATNHR
jgi:hypothetical protein